MKQKLFLKRTLLFCLVLSCFLVLQAFAAEVPRMSKEDLQSMLGNPEVIIIDVRLSGDSPGTESRIKGAIREDPGQVDSWIDKYPKNKILVFYCA